MHKAILERLIIGGCLFLLSGIDHFVKAELLLSNVSSAPITHRHVSKPILLSETKRLLVSLEQYLGSNYPKGSDKTTIKLVSAGRPLVLKDSTGLVHKSSTVRIAWQKVPLESPINIARKVIGPFSSFESAERIASLLSEYGIENIIAHPADWEIWIANETSLPKGMQSRLFRKTILKELRPVLKVGSSEYLLSDDLVIHAPDGMFWKGGLYSGPFLLKPDAYGTWTLLEDVSLEKYLHGVLPHEIGSSSPPTALAAQAVLARTWAISNSHRFEIDGYHLCSDTQCQVYKDPAKANKAVAIAIAQTAGKVLNWQGEPIHAVYHATNGGVSASANEAWAMKNLPYLKTFLDGSSRWKKQFLLPLNQTSNLKRFLAKRDGAFGNSHHRFRWRRILTAEEIKKLLKFPNSKNSEVKNVFVLERGNSGRVLALQIESNRDDLKVILRLDDIRRKLRNLPSTLFYIQEIKKGEWEFIGGGFGHGAGLSQAGAIDLALRGWTTPRILQHYYPGTTYEPFK